MAADRGAACGTEYSGKFAALARRILLARSSWVTEQAQLALPVCDEFVPHGEGGTLLFLSAGRASSLHDSLLLG